MINLGMNQEKQRIAIAEACGYKRLTQHEAVWSHKGSKIYTVGNLPDYLNDLNAMHEAEKVLTEDQEWDFVKLLVNYQQHEGGFPLLSLDEALRLRRANAAQRAEAFLRTIHKWEEGK